MAGPPPVEPRPDEYYEDEGPRSLKDRFTARPNIGTWIGVLAMFTFLFATALPWYTISAEIDPYVQRATIIEFDGLRGLYVDERLAEFLDFGLPNVLLPITLIVAVMLVFRLRSLFKAPSPGKRAGSFIRSTVGILLPIGLALFVITQVPNFVPPDAPTEIHQLAASIGSQPLGGSERLEINTSVPPISGQATVSMDWGFGLALYVMIGAVGLYIVAAMIEASASRRMRMDEA